MILEDLQNAENRAPVIQTRFRTANKKDDHKWKSMQEEDPLLSMYVYWFICDFKLVCFCSGWWWYAWKWSFVVGIVINEENLEEMEP